MYLRLEEEETSAEFCDKRAKHKTYIELFARKLRFDLCLASFKSAKLAIVIAEKLVSCIVIVQGNTVLI
jgi:IS4 transposase